MAAILITIFYEKNMTTPLTEQDILNALSDINEFKRIFNYYSVCLPHYPLNKHFPQYVDRIFEVILSNKDVFLHVFSDEDISIIIPKYLPQYVDRVFEVILSNKDVFCRLFESYKYTFFIN